MGVGSHTGGPLRTLAPRFPVPVTDHSLEVVQVPPASQPLSGKPGPHV